MIPEKKKLDKRAAVFVAHRRRFGMLLLRARRCLLVTGLP